MPEGNEFGDTFAEHKFLTAILIYFVVGIIFWLWTFSSYGPKIGSDSRILKFFEKVFLPVSIPGGAFGSLLFGRNHPPY